MTAAKRLRQRVEDLEKELSEQKLVNQQQTLILLELIKVTNLNVQGTHLIRLVGSRPFSSVQLGFGRPGWS